jgi:hypothetical protein
MRDAMFKWPARAVRAAHTTASIQQRSFRTTLPRFARPAKRIPSQSATQITLRPSAKGTLKPRTAAIPTSAGLVSRQQFLARQLYNAGVREVYSHRRPGRIYATWAIAGCFAIYALNLFRMRLWDPYTLEDMGKTQKTFVSYAHRAGIAFCILSGGIVVAWYAGPIRSMQLLDFGSSQGIQVVVKMRRRVPWSKTHFFVDPAQIVLPKNWRTTLQEELELTRGKTSPLRRAFRSSKAWITRTGIISPVKVGERTFSYIDGAGRFEVPFADFEAITSQKYV